ncbi:hypothetical protein D9M68_479680 [compost metagenome]
MAGRVARAVVDLQRFIAELHGVAVFKPAVRLEAFGMAEAEAPRLVGQLLDPEAFILLRPFDRNGEFARQRRGTRAVVDVAVRQEDFLQRNRLLPDRFADAFEIAARVADGGGAGAFVDQQRTVLLEGGDRDKEDFHR